MTVLGRMRDLVRDSFTTHGRKDEDGSLAEHVPETISPATAMAASDHKLGGTANGHLTDNQIPSTASPATNALAPDHSLKGSPRGSTPEHVPTTISPATDLVEPDHTLASCADDQPIEQAPLRVPQATDTVASDHSLNGSLKSDLAEQARTNVLPSTKQIQPDSRLESDSQSSLAEQLTTTVSPATSTLAPDRSLSRLLAGYLERVTCGVTGEQATAATVLPGVYNFADPELDNTLLRNLIEPSNPAVPCGIYFNKEWYPANKGQWGHQYELHIRFNRLLFAPCVLLECKLPARPDKSRPMLTLEVVFHFNPCDDTVLRGFGYTAHKNSKEAASTLSNGEITFKFDGATLRGFNHITQFTDSFSLEQTAIISVLRSFRKMDTFRCLKFQLLLSKLSQEDQRSWTKIMSHLPGGDGEQLQTLGVPEYSAYRMLASTRPFSEELEQHARETPLHCMVPPPVWVSLQHPGTFPSMKDYSEHMGIAAWIEHQEQRVALKLWQAAEHTGVVFKHDKYAIFCVNSARVRVLGSNDEQTTYRLPDELNVTIELKYRRHSGEWRELVLRAFLSPEKLPLPPHHYCFVITSHTAEELGEDLVREPGKGSPPASDYHNLDIQPHFTTFGATSRQIAKDRILKSGFSTWHQILTAQDFDSLPEVDMTAGIDRSKLAKPDAWLEEMAPWDAEQRMVIESKHKAKGGLQIVMGPAGTGKTLLITGLSIYMAMLGMKVMVFTAANSNADHSICDIAAKAKDHNLRVFRIYSSSADHSLRNMSTEQTSYRRRDGHHKGYASNSDRLLFLITNLSKPATAARALDIEHGVIQEADEGTLRRRQRLPIGEDGRLGPEVDIWEVFRSHLNACRDKKFDHKKFQKDEQSRREFEVSYQACKRHLLRMADIVITTTGNAACAEIAEDFLDESIYEQAGFTGLFKIFEEAAKDQEPNVLNGLVQGRPECVRGVFMFGDEKQLRPVNTSAQGKVQYNPFRECLSKSLPTRLLEEGFQCIRLLQQHRMRHCLADPVNRFIYNSKLRSAPETNRPLPPDLKKALLSIIAGVRYPMDEIAQKEYVGTASDNDACVAWFEVFGKRISHDKSSAVLAHVYFFVREILPGLMSFFKERMHHEVMIVCAYKYTKQLYQTEIDKFRARHKDLTDAHFPKVLTADSAQGQEAEMVWLDCAIQDCNVQGFVLRNENDEIDLGRANVCLTRGKQVLWMVGGDLSFRRFPFPKRIESKDDDFGPFPKYKKELEEQDRVHVYDD